MEHLAKYAYFSAHRIHETVELTLGSCLIIGTGADTKLCSD